MIWSRTRAWMRHMNNMRKTLLFFCWWKMRWMRGITILNVLPGNCHELAMKMPRSHVSGLKPHVMVIILLLWNMCLFSVCYIVQGARFRKLFRRVELWKSKYWPRVIFQRWMLLSNSIKRCFKTQVLDSCSFAPNQYNFMYHNVRFICNKM